MKPWTKHYLFFLSLFSSIFRFLTELRHSRVSKAESPELLLGEAVEHLFGLLIHEAELGFLGGEFRVEVGRVLGVLDPRFEGRRHLARFEILPVDFIEEGVAADGSGGAVRHAEPLRRFAVEEKTEQILGLSPHPSRHLRNVVANRVEQFVLVPAVERRLTD